jgi:hypothetical protein
LLELFPRCDHDLRPIIMNPTTTILKGDYRFMYRTHESGQAGSGTREPKQSWEVSAARIASSHHLSSSSSSSAEDSGWKEDAENESFGPPDLLREKDPVLLTRVTSLLPNWATWMHSVAITVARALDLPRNAWLVEDEPEDVKDSSSSSSSGSSPPHHHRLDLPRAFLYEITPPKQLSPSGNIPQQNANHQSSSLSSSSPSSNLEQLPIHPDQADQDGVDEFVWGSSPHSDWGAFTVIWQDEVGGLCLQCPRCGTWRPVPPSATGLISELKDNNEVVHLIILVGDLTSLAMNLQAQQASAELGLAAARSAPQDSFPSLSRRRTTTTARESPFWPSPRHGVLCPQQGPPRASLVYFCYPPPHQTLDGMIDQLSQVKSQGAGRSSSREFRPGWVAPEDEHMVAPPLSSYSLLQNQAVQLDVPFEPLNDDMLGRLDRQLQSIRYLPVANVLIAKWDQVQRSY